MAFPPPGSCDFLLIAEHLKSGSGLRNEGQSSPNKKKINLLSLMTWSQSTTPTSAHIFQVSQGRGDDFPCVFWELAYFLFVYCLCASVLLF